MARVSLEEIPVIDNTRNQENARSKIIRKVFDEISRS